MHRKPNYKRLVVLSISTLAISLMARVFADGLEYLSTRTLNQSFTQMQHGLSNDEIDEFILGKSFFRIPWVEAPSATTARDGLGPLFSANTCVNCHAKKWSW